MRLNDVHPRWAWCCDFTGMDIDADLAIQVGAPRRPSRFPLAATEHRRCRPLAPTTVAAAALSAAPCRCRPLSRPTLQVYDEDAYMGYDNDDFIGYARCVPPRPPPPRQVGV